MEIKDLRAFYAVVEEGNISHAAQRLNVTQSVISRQMKRLEESLGVRLFERGNRQIRLTDAGKAFHLRTENILGLLDGALEEVQDIEGGAAGSVKIGTITTSGAMILPRLTAKFHEHFPKIKFELWEADGSRIFELLDSRIIEIAITRTQTNGDDAYSSIVLPNEPLMIVMRRETAVGEAKDNVRLAELTDTPLIVPLRWQSSLNDFCRKLGFTPNIVCVSRSSAMDILFVRQKMGAAILPASALEIIEGGDLIAKRLIEPEMTTHTVVSWLKNQPLSLSCRRFLTMFREMFAPQGSS